MPDEVTLPAVNLTDPAPVEPTVIRFDSHGQPINAPEFSNEPDETSVVPDDVPNDSPDPDNPLPAPVVPDNSAKEKQTYTAEEVAQIRAQAAAEVERKMMERQLLGDSKQQLSQYIASDPYVQELNQKYLQAKDINDTETMTDLETRYTKQKAVLEENFYLRQQHTMRVSQEITQSQAALDQFAQTIGIDSNEFYKSPEAMDGRIDALLTKLEKQGKLRWEKRGEYEYPHLTGDVETIKKVWSQDLRYGITPKAPAKPERPNQKDFHAPSPESSAGSERSVDLTNAQMEATWANTNEGVSAFSKLSPNEQLKSYRGFKAWEKGLKDTGYTPPVVPQHIRNFEKRLPRN